MKKSGGEGWEEETRECCLLIWSLIDVNCSFPDNIFCLNSFVLSLSLSLSLSLAFFSKFDHIRIRSTFNVLNHNDFSLHIQNSTPWIHSDVSFILFVVILLMREAGERKYFNTPSNDERKNTRMERKRRKKREEQAEVLSVNYSDANLSGRSFVREYSVYVLSYENDALFWCFPLCFSF